VCEQSVVCGRLRYIGERACRQDQRERIGDDIFVCEQSVVYRVNRRRLFVGRRVKSVICMREVAHMGYMVYIGEVEDGIYGIYKIGRRWEIREGIRV
jgi:hypothetical protein